MKTLIINFPHSVKSEIRDNLKKHNQKLGQEREGKCEKIQERF